MVDRVETALLLAVANRAMERAVEIEAEQIQEARDRTRRYRTWLKHRGAHGWDEKF